MHVSMHSILKTYMQKILKTFKIFRRSVSFSLHKKLTDHMPRKLDNIIIVTIFVMFSTQRTWDLSVKT